MKLERGTHDTNGRTIYYIKDPATYPIRTQLGRSGAGLQYWNGMWWTYNVNPSMLNKLRSLNIDVSIASASPTAVNQDSGSISNPVQSEQPSVTESVVPESQSAKPENNSLFKMIVLMMVHRSYIILELLRRQVFLLRRVFILQHSVLRLKGKKYR